MMIVLAGLAAFGNAARVNNNVQTAARTAAEENAARALRREQLAMEETGVIKMELEKRDRAKQ